MEWDDYYEDYLLLKKMSLYEDNIDQAAAIIGQDGKVWAQTSNFPQVEAEERIAIMREFDEPGTLTMIGLYLGGTRYVVTGAEPGDVIRATKLVEADDITRAWKAISLPFRERMSSGFIVHDAKQTWMADPIRPSSNSIDRRQSI